MDIGRYQAPNKAELERLFKQMGIGVTEVAELLALAEEDVERMVRGEREMRFTELFTLAYRVSQCEVGPEKWRIELWLPSRSIQWNHD